jgi:hypothetical protein
MKLRRTQKFETSEALAKEVGLRLQKVRSGVVVEGQGPPGIDSSTAALLGTFAADSGTRFISKTAPQRRPPRRGNG